MTTDVDVLVVGGGVSGISCAHHLRGNGATTRVIERDGVAQATSTCGAGFIGQWAAGFVSQLGAEELACERYALEFYRLLNEDRPGFGFRHSGMLFLALTPQAWETRLQPVADFTAGTTPQVLDADEAVEAGKILSRSGIVGAVWHPESVQLRGSDAVRAMVDRLRLDGVTIEERRPATGLLVDSGRVVGVDTTQGPIRAGAVVLATAMWTNQLLAGEGIWLPYAPMGALRITTEPLNVPPDTPMLMIPEVDAWVREEDGRLLWGCLYTGEHRDAFLDAPPPDRIEQLPMDGLWETQRVGVKLSAAIPSLARYRGFTYAQGAPCYTPDLRALVGPVPGLENLYLLTGDNESGITHGPGLGRALAERVLGIPPFIELTGLDPARFGDTYRSAREVATALGDDIWNKVG